MTPAKTEWVKKMIDGYGEHHAAETLMALYDYNHAESKKMVEDTKVAYTIADRVIDDLLSDQIEFPGRGMI